MKTGWRSSIRSSLFTRVMLIVLAAVSVLWLVLVAYSANRFYRQGDGVIDADLKLLAESLARFSSVDPTPAQIASVAQQLKEINASRSNPALGDDEFAYAVMDANGTILSASSAQPFGADGDLKRIGTKHRTEFADWAVIGSYSPDKKLFAAVGQANAFFKRGNVSVATYILLQYLVSVVILTFVVWVAVRVGLKPLARLTNQIEAITPESMATITPDKHYSELTPLVDALNTRITQVARLLAHERAFFADAAHELRTPLAALEAQASVVALEEDASARRLAARELEASVTRTADVLGKLLTSARLDGIEGLPTVAQLDLHKLLEELVSQFAPRVFAAGKQIEFDSLESSMILGDVNALRIAFENLLDNAIRYTPSGALIAVRVTAQSESVTVIIEDDGPGIPASQRERVFERFVRLHDQEITGTGLGLAIVKRIVELHSGSIRIEDSSATPTPHGARFVIRFPKRS